MDEPSLNDIARMVAETHVIGEYGPNARVAEMAITDVDWSDTPLGEVFTVRATCRVAPYAQMVQISFGPVALPD